MLMYIQPYSRLTGPQLGERGKASPPLFDVEKTILILERNTLILSTFGLNLSFKI